METLESEILKILTRRKFCRKKPKAEKIIQQIKEAVREGEPLTFLAIFGSYKNPNVITSPWPDLSEEKTLERMAKLMSQLKTIYSPGGIIKLVTTGKKGELANKIPSERIQIYEGRIKEIVKENNFPIEMIPWGDLFEKYKEICELPEVKEETREIHEKFNQFKQNQGTEENKIFWQKQIDRARRHAPPNTPEEEIEERALNYIIYTDIIEPRLLQKEFGEEVINLSFRPEIDPTTIPLFTCKKGVIKQPWNNTCEGCQFQNKCISTSETTDFLSE